MKVDEIEQRALIEMISGMYFSIFDFLKKRNQLDAVTVNDFNEFHDTVTRKIIEHGSKFTFKIVFEELPNNKWIPIYIEALKALNKNNPEIHTPSLPLHRSLRDSTTFNEICSRIADVAHGNQLLH